MVRETGCAFTRPGGAAALLLACVLAFVAGSRAANAVDAPEEKLRVSPEVMKAIEELGLKPENDKDRPEQVNAEWKDAANPSFNRIRLEVTPDDSEENDVVFLDEIKRNLPVREPPKYREKEVAGHKVILISNTGLENDASTAPKPDQVSYFVTRNSGIFFRCGHHCFNIGIVTGQKVGESKDYEKQLQNWSKQAEDEVPSAVKEGDAYLEKVMAVLKKHKCCGGSAFWEWYLTFSQLVAESNKTIAFRQRQAAFVGIELQDQLRRAHVLQNAVTAGTDRTTIDMVLQKMGIASEPAEPPDKAAARLMPTLRNTVETVADLRKEIELTQADASASVAKLISELDAAIKRDNLLFHPEMRIWREHFQEVAANIPLDFAVLSNDPTTMQAALDAASRLPQTANTLKRIAQLQMSSSDPVAALFTLRRAVAANPRDRDAAAQLMRLECAFVKSAIEKAQGAIADARASFRKYMQESGLGEHDSIRWGDRRGMDWLPGRLHDLDGEQAWAIFTMGVTRSVSAVADDRPEDEARALEATESEMVKAFKGLHLILHLRARGLSLEQIAKMTSADLLKAAPVKNLNGQPFTEAQGHLLGAYLQSALKLRDIAPLLGNDPKALRDGMKSLAWDPSDVGDTWAEWFGDISSPRNLLLNLLPMSVGTVGGRLAGVGYTGALRSTALEGEVVSGSGMLANLTGWTRAVEYFGGRANGKALLELLERSHHYRQSLGVAGQFGWGLGQAMAIATLQSVGASMAEKYGGDSARVLFEALVLFGTDTDSLRAALKRGGISQETVSAVLEKRVLPGLRSEIKQIEAAEQQGKVLTKLLEEQKAKPAAPPGQPPAAPDPAIDRALTDAGLPPGLSERSREAARLFLKGEFVLADDLKRWRIELGEERGALLQQALMKANDHKTLSDAEYELFTLATQEAVPNGSPIHDSQIAREAAANANRAGAVDEGAVTVSGSFKPLVEQERDALQGLLKNAENMAAGLRVAPQRNMGDAFKRRSAYFGRERAWVVTPGSLTARGHASLQAGNFKEADKLFREAAEKVERGIVPEADELPALVLRKGAEMARELAMDIHAPASGVPPPGLSQTTKDVIQDAERDAALASGWEKDAYRASTGGGGGATYSKAPGQYVYKVPKQHAALLDCESELVHAEILRELGLEAPAATIKIEKVGNDERMILITRKVEGGKSLNDLEAKELFRLREQYSRHRVASVLLGDFDRKIDNYMIDAQGRLIAIDGGYADPRGLHVKNEVITGPGADARVTDPEFMEGAFGRDHWYQRCRNAFDQHAEDAFFSKMLLIEQSMTYQSAKPAVDDALKLLADEGRLRGALQRAYTKLYPADKVKGMVDEAIKTLRDRGSRLDEVMRGLNNRNGLPLPGAGSRVWPQRDLRLLFPAQELARAA